MDDLERRIRAEYAAYRLLKVDPDSVTPEKIQIAWKRAIVELHRKGKSEDERRDLNVARDTALAALKWRKDLQSHSDAIANVWREMAEGMEQAFAPLRRRQEREQEALHGRARDKAWMDWAMPRINGRYGQPFSQGWFDFSTKPGMDLIAVGYRTTDENVRKEMQERLDLIQKLHRKELARANRARRKT